MRRLVARTMSHQLVSPAQQGRGVRHSTSQCAMTTKAGTECIAHALQALTESNPQCTMTVDGIGAFDQISRASMLGALRDVEGGSQALPFEVVLWATVPVLLGRQCRCCAPCGLGRRRRTGRRNDASPVPLGQHAALLAVQGRLVAGERLMAFWDDVRGDTILTEWGRFTPRWTWITVTSASTSTGEKTQVWNAVGIGPRACDELERIAQEADPTARV